MNDLETAPVFAGNKGDRTQGGGRSMVMWFIIGGLVVAVVAIVMFLTPTDLSQSP